MFNILTFKCQAIKQAQVQYKMSNWITWFLSAILLNNVKLNSSKTFGLKYFARMSFPRTPGSCRGGRGWSGWRGRWTRSWQTSRWRGHSPAPTAGRTHPVSGHFWLGLNRGRVNIWILLYINMLLYRDVFFCLRLGQNRRRIKVLRSG